MVSPRIDLNQYIQPLSEFRKHAAEFVERVKSKKRAIVLTQHGKSAAVLVDVSEYQQMLDRLDLLDELSLAEKQVANGDVLTNDEARIQIMQKLSKWK